MNTGGRAINAITVYCGSSGLAVPHYGTLAREVGGALAAKGWELVYGGGSVGLMGVLADAALGAGGRVTGVITRQLVGFEVAHRSLTNLHVVESMHERKEWMSRLGDAFLVLPGGYGTLDELFEAVSWRQLGLHAKPVVLLAGDDFFDPLRALLHGAAGRGLIRAPHLDLVAFARTVEAALEAIERPPALADGGDRWWLDGVEPPLP